MFCKLAARNVLRSVRDYGVYLLTLTFGVCLFYTFNAIEGQGVMAYLAAAQSDMVRVIQILIDVFSVFVSVVLACLIVYADRFLMRRRKRELGTCLILGMSQGQVSRMLFLETGLIGLVSLLLGLGLVVSAFGQDIGASLNSAMPFLDKSTWTVLFITLAGLIGAVTPVGRMAGSTELSNLLLYSVVALLASRASFLELTDAPAWILAGFMILAIHGIILVLLAKIFHLDMFTCGVASLANIGGSASAPILAGAYSGALVPVGVLMALMGYVIGTAGGLITANIMSLLA